jgi:hypothetical protein
VVEDVPSKPTEAQEEPHDFRYCLCNPCLEEWDRQQQQQLKRNRYDWVRRMTSKEHHENPSANPAAEHAKQWNRTRNDLCKRKEDVEQARPLKERDWCMDYLQNSLGRLQLIGGTGEPPTLNNLVRSNNLRHVPFYAAHQPLSRILVLHVFKNYLGISLEDTLEPMAVARFMYNYLSLATFLEWRMDEKDRQAKASRAKSVMEESWRYWQVCCLENENGRDTCGREDCCGMSGFDACKGWSKEREWFTNKFPTNTQWPSWPSHAVLGRFGIFRGGMSTELAAAQLKKHIELEGSQLQNFMSCITKMPHKFSFKKHKAELERLGLWHEDRNVRVWRYSEGGIWSQQEREALPVWEEALVRAAYVTATSVVLQCTRFIIQTAKLCLESAALSTMDWSGQWYCNVSDQLISLLLVLI